MVIKYISFNLDGTLIDIASFDDIFWREEIPRLYAEQYKMTLEEAKKVVFAEFDNKGSASSDWYYPSFWFKKLKLKHDPKKIMQDMSPDIRVYNDVIPALKELSKKYKLIILTRSTHEMADIKVEVEGLKKHFKKVYSTLDDFKLVKKDQHIYSEILKKHKIKPTEMIHIGDNFNFDFLAPRSIGIHSFCLNRKAKKSQLYTVKNLNDFVKKVVKFDE